MSTTLTHLLEHELLLVKQFKGWFRVFTNLVITMHAGAPFTNRILLNIGHRWVITCHSFRGCTHLSVPRCWRWDNHSTLIKQDPNALVPNDAMPQANSTAYKFRYEFLKGYITIGEIFFDLLASLKKPTWSRKYRNIWSNGKVFE